MWTQLHMDLGGNSALEKQQHPQGEPQGGLRALSRIPHHGIAEPLQLQGAPAPRPHGVAVKSHIIPGPKSQFPSAPRPNTHRPTPQGAPTL